MTTSILLAAIAGFGAGVARALLTSLLAGDVKGYLHDLLKSRVRGTARRLPESVAEEFETEWVAELETLKDRPLLAWLFVRGLQTAATAIRDQVGGSNEARLGADKLPRDEAEATSVVTSAGALEASLGATKLFVGGLPFDTTDDSLGALFARVVDLESAIVVKDRDTGRSKGFGFVELSSGEAATAAVTALNGYPVDGRSISVSVARPKEDGR